MTTHLDFLVGSYTRPEGHVPHPDGLGVTRHRLDLHSGEVTPLGTLLEAPNPTWLALHPDGEVLYTVHELDPGEVRAYRLAPDGTARHLVTRASGGAYPVHAELDAANTALLCVNYGIGAALARFPLGTDGQPQEAQVLAHVQGHGPDASRQDAPHPHSVTVSPDGRHAWVPDLGSDRVWTVDLQAAPGTPAGTLTLPPGSGPRHLAFTPDGRHAVLTLELTASVALLARDPDTGAPHTLQVLPLPVPAGAKADASSVTVSPDGRFAYVASRGSDELHVLATGTGDPATGTATSLSAIQAVPTLGRTPRAHVLSPDGRFLIVGNQDSSTLAVYRRDPETGHLADGRTFPCPTPACFAFLP